MNGTTQGERLNAVVANRFNQLKLSDKGSAEVSGPQIVPVENDAGQQELKLGWLVMVTLYHNRLVGQPPIALVLPIEGALPHDTLFEGVTEFLQEKCREVRHQLNSTPAAARADLANLPAGLKR